MLLLHDKYYCSGFKCIDFKPLCILAHELSVDDRHIFQSIPKISNLWDSPVCSSITIITAIYTSWFKHHKNPVRQVPAYSFYLTEQQSKAHKDEIICLSDFTAPKCWGWHPKPNASCFQAQHSCHYPERHLSSLPLGITTAWTLA